MPKAICPKSPDGGGHHYKTIRSLGRGKYQQRCSLCLDTREIKLTDDDMRMGRLVAIMHQSEVMKK